MAAKGEKRNGNGRRHQLFLGVDGGGTKTHIAIMTYDGKVTCEGFAGPSNPLRVGVETAVENIVKAVNEACDAGAASRGDIVAATVGLAGVRRADLRQRVRERIVKTIGVRNTTVLTDAEIALYATTKGKPGLVVIAGTGSICLGKNEKGKIAISGGWGPLTLPSSRCFPAAAADHRDPELLLGDARRELAHDLALEHDEDPVGEREDLFELERDEQHASALVALPDEAAVHELDRADVEPAGRLRGDQDPRVAVDLAREHDLLLVPARE